MKRLLSLTLAAGIALPAHLVCRVAYAAPPPRAYSSSGAGSRVRNGMALAVSILKQPTTWGALAGLVAVGGTAYHIEAARPKLIPLAFSEISQIERDAKAAGTELSPATIYLASVNESSMKVFEAWNESHAHLAPDSEAGNFAQELHFKLDLDTHSHKLPQLLKELPGQAQAVRAALDPLVTVTNGMRPVNGNFRASWDDSHHDNYHTEYRTRTVTDYDSKGKRSGSHTETYTVQVYDDTTHTYDYNRGAGEAASAGIDLVRAKVPSISGLPTLRVASKTNAQGDLAQDVSRELEGAKVLTAAQHQEIASLWATGATYSQNVGSLMNLWNNVLAKDGNDWRAQKASARSDRYKTTSHYDSGPKEFQTARRTLTNGEEFVRQADEVLASIDYAERTAPVLDAKIRELVKLKLEKQGTGDADKLTGEIMDMSRTLYKMNFVRGVDTKEYRAWVVLLFSLAGLLGGAGAVHGGSLALTAAKRKLNR